MSSTKTFLGNGKGLSVKTARQSGALLALATIAFLCTPARAEPQLPGGQAALNAFETAGGKFDYLGNAHGLDGWILISPKGDTQYIYTTPDGALLKGTLYAPDGSSETLRQLKAYEQKMSGGQAATPGAEKSAMPAEQLYAAAEKANWVALGNAQAPYLYVFMNANCDHCRDYWADLSDQVAAGRFQVRLIPFGDADANRTAGAALLSATDPMAAWKAWAAGDQGALGADKIKDGAAARLEANTALVKKWRLPTPPFTLYRRPADGKIVALVGRPENKMLLPSEFMQLK